MRLYASLHAIFPGRRQVLDLLAHFLLDEKAEVRAQDLSGGQRSVSRWRSPM